MEGRGKEGLATAPHQLKREDGGEEGEEKRVRGTYIHSTDLHRPHCTNTFGACPASSPALTGSGCRLNDLL